MSAGFRGTLEAVGFVIDPRVVGSDVALERVERLWTPGARLLVDDGSLVLLLAAPVSVRADRAPGLPLRAHGADVEVPGPDGWRRLDVGVLPPADLASWLLVDVDTAVLHPVPAPPVGAPLPPAPPAPRPDLRGAARVARPGRVAARDLQALGDLSRAEAARGRRGLGPTRRGGGARPGPAKDSLLARLALRTPAARVLGRRHAAYVERLTASFERGDWSEALSSAIAMGGLGGALSLRLPGRRGRVTGPSTGPGGGGRAVAYGGTVAQHLGTLYRDAAQRLEREGRFMEAAFVHADLLGVPLAAVELLERNGQARLAAELAEGWGVDPGVVVRLWWRAGDRRRAVQVARTRGAFAAALTRLGATDPVLSRELRTAWVHSERDAGDHAGAVDAAWPDEQVRTALLPELLDDIAAGIAVGGPSSGHLLARLLDTPSGAGALGAAAALLVDDDLAAARVSFLRTFGGAGAADPAADRQLAGQAVVRLLTEVPGLPDAERGRLLGVLKPRADPLLAADLPSSRPTGPRAGPVPVRLTGVADEARRPVDVVAVGVRSVLVAFGDSGVRLLGPDGRVRARWEVPAHRIVVADHGARVLLAARRGDVWTVHRLDLPLGRPHLLPPLRAGRLPDTYDGHTLVVGGDGRIDWLTVDRDRWVVGWTELAGEARGPVVVHRSPASLSAQFRSVDPALGDQVWKWTLPDRTLRQRGAARPAAVQLPSGLGAGFDETPAPALVWRSPDGAVRSRTSVARLPVHGVGAVGTGFQVVTSQADDVGLVATQHAEPGAEPDVVVHLPDDAGHVVRRWGSLLTVEHRGHVVVVDTLTRRVVADLRADPR